MLKLLINNLLDNDDGISSEAYGALLDYLASIGEDELLAEVNNKVKCTDDKYYFALGPEWEPLWPGGWSQRAK